MINKELTWFQRCMKTKMEGTTYRSFESHSKAWQRMAKQCSREGKEKWK